MRFTRRKSRHDVSPAWISFSDLFSQVMVISLVLALFFVFRAHTEKKRAAEAEERSRQIQDQIYTVTGKVIGLNPEEWRSTRLILNEQNYPVDYDGAFRITGLHYGCYNLKLETKHRETSFVDFSLNSSGFRGFNILAGKVLDEKGDVSGENGLAIDPLTDEIVAFATADHSLLPSGEGFLRREFTKLGTDGISLLERLKANPSLRIAVVGQADLRKLHKKSYTNLGLSALRAAAVGDFLVRQLGIGAEQVMVLGLGATREWLPPQKPGESLEEYYSRCRRILIMFAENADQALLRKVSEIN